MTPGSRLHVLVRPAHRPLDSHWDLAGGHHGWTARAIHFNPGHQWAIASRSPHCLRNGFDARDSPLPPQPRAVLRLPKQGVGTRTWMADLEKWHAPGHTKGTRRPDIGLVATRQLVYVLLKVYGPMFLNTYWPLRESFQRKKLETLELSDDIIQYIPDDNFRGVIISAMNALHKSN